MKIRSDFKKVRCPKGDRYVLRDMNQLPRTFFAIMPKYGFNLNLNLKGLMDILQSGNFGNIEAGLRKQYESLLEAVEDLDINAYMKFSAAYMTYASNPCENEKILERVTETLNGQNSTLSEVYTTIEKFRRDIADAKKRQDRAQIDQMKDMLDQAIIKIQELRDELDNL